MYKKNIKPINPEKKKKKKDVMLNSDDKFIKFIYNNKKIQDLNNDDKNKNKK